MDSMGAAQDDGLSSMMRNVNVRSVVYCLSHGQDQKTWQDEIPVLKKSSPPGRQGSWAPKRPSPRVVKDSGAWCRSS